jgi:hypothetical protein
MKQFKLTLLAVLSACYSFAQVGIGTTSPNTTLDVRGSLAANSRSFSTTSESVQNTDYALLFTGNSACTLTLPDATGCIGRIIHIKNTKTGTVPVLTIATTAAQTIDGQSTWLLDDPNESVNVVSNGSNWLIMGQTLPVGSGTAWTQGGNGVASIKTLGTTTNYDLPFITNNSERMRISSTGNVKIGTSSFDATNPEKLLVDAGTTSSFNVISGKGSIDNYLQLNIQNRSATANASSDVVATADNGTESINYVDLGINSSTYSNVTYPIISGANNAYLYSTGNDFIIGNGTANRNLQFFTGGYATSNERMRVTGAGNVGIGTTSPSEKLQVDGNIRLSGVDRGIFFDATSDPYAGMKLVTRTNETSELMLFAGNDVSGTWGADRIRLASHEIHFATTNTTGGINSGDATSFYSNTTSVPTQMMINEDGNVAIGTTTFDANNPKLQIDAGSGGSTALTPISAIGTTNNYLQLNVQNLSNGNIASSDVVATANNGSASTVYIDMGINSQGYSSGSSSILNGANTAYLYATGNDFYIGNGAQNKNLILFTNTGTTGADGTERMRITSGGTVSINSNSPNTSYKLYVNGSAYASSWNTPSDRRLKTNIHSLGYGLKEIMSLQPVSYNWIDPNVSKQNQLGLIAQDLRKIIPEAVNGNEQKETLSVNYTELIPILVNAIKEQQQQIEQLEKKVKTLEHK